MVPVKSVLNPLTPLTFWVIFKKWAEIKYSRIRKKKVQNLPN